MKETVYYRDLVKSFPTMRGKNIVITGCTSGTGYVLAKTCGKLGATVFMLNRPSERATSALTQLREESDSVFVPIECDLQDFSSVRKAGEELRDHLGKKGCDVLCNNAGIMASPDLATTDGFDIQIQTNHLSHFLLTHELWPVLRQGVKLRSEARVINHSSGARKMGKKSIITEYFEPNGGNLGGDRFPGLDKWIRYQQSKLANLLFSYGLHEKRPSGIDQKILALTAHPGPTDSGLQTKTINTGGNRLLDRYIIGRTLKAAHSVEDGTSGIARCACGLNVNSGDFYGPVGRGKPGPAVLLPSERDVDSEELLWKLSMKATGIGSFFP